eukprot:IDg23184t1
MDSDASGSMKVGKLNETNFHAWKQKIQLLLAWKELDEHIEDDPPARETSEFPNWRRRDKRAMACIGLSLSDALLENVREASTAKEMWTLITNVFERHTLLNKLSARRKFYTATMLDGEKILKYANRIRQLATTLKNMGVDIDDNEMAMALLNGLPDRFDSLISALDALGNEDKIFTFEFVKSRLLQEEQRADMRVQTSIVKSEAAALVAHDHFESSSTCKHRTKCDHCGMLGHVVAKCWKKNPHLRPAFFDRRKKRSALIVGPESAGQNNENDNQHICLMGKVAHCLMGKIKTSKVPKGSKSWFIDS